MTSVIPGEIPPRNTDVVFTSFTNPGGLLLVGGVGRELGAGGNPGLGRIFPYGVGGRMGNGVPLAFAF